MFVDILADFFPKASAVRTAVASHAGEAGTASAARRTISRRSFCKTCFEAKILVGGDTTKQIRTKARQSKGGTDSYHFICCFRSKKNEKRQQ